MTYSTIATASRDPQLVDRVVAAAQKEAHNGSVKDTAHAAELRADPSQAVDDFMWPIAIEYEAAYESALAAGNPSPGSDLAVITDANITASVQANWPPDPT
jgi:hypothetical protein